jgi:hypothetical protein
VGERAEVVVVEGFEQRDRLHQLDTVHRAATVLRVAAACGCTAHQACGKLETAGWPAARPPLPITADHFGGGPYENRCG